MRIKLNANIDFDELKDGVVKELSVVVIDQLEQYLNKNLHQLVEGHLKNNPIEPEPPKRTRYTQDSIITDDTGVSKTILEWSLETGVPITTIIGRKRKDWSDNDTIHTPLHKHKISENI